MKTFALLLVAFFLAARFVSAQENYGTIHVITKVMPDKSQVTTKMDPDTHTAEETVTDASNKLLRKTIYSYDANNSAAVSAMFYDAKGTPTHKATYTRDGAGRVTEAAFSTPDGRYLGKRVYVYTATTGDASQIIDYDADGKQISVAQAVTKGKAKGKH